MRIARMVSAAFLLPLLILCSGLVQAQQPADKYWIMFTDKGDQHELAAEQYLSPRSLERRARMGIPVDDRDLPLNPAYLETLDAMQIDRRQRSKWFNAVSAWLSPAELEAVEQLPFVREVRAIPKVIVDYDAPDAAWALARLGYDAGFTDDQIEMLGLDRLHAHGYDGTGILIALMDNGFNGADENPWLRHVFEDDRVIATWDFVNNEADVFDQGNHGQWVWSILAGWFEAGVNPNMNFYGSAYGASYILCHTENDLAEEHQEEDNWVAAMEYADSIGADIFSTSLGYRNFDNGDDYGYQGMDGNTTIITRGADIAASRGIVVVNSAGNSGNGKIIAPADGDSVIAVGAVDSARVITNFSSRGPSFDGRVKPDVCAQGGQTSFLQSSGSFSRGNGTSFSCPVTSGMLACVLQAAPQTANMDLYQALIASADRYSNPDDEYGYGIPYAPAMVKSLTGIELPPAFAAEALDESGTMVYPNPSSGRIVLLVDAEEAYGPGLVQVIDARGRIVYERNVELTRFVNAIELDRNSDFPNSASGMYTIRLMDATGKTMRFQNRFLMFDNR